MKPKYKIGDRVKIIDEISYLNSDHPKRKYTGTVMTVRKVHTFSNGYLFCYRMEEDKEECRGDGWLWDDEDIAGLAEESTPAPPPVSPSTSSSQSQSPNVYLSPYVLNKHGEPLMPCSPRKARLLLRDKKAKVIKRTPFTIKLLYGSSGYKQPITLGVDAGSKHIGLSACTDSVELYKEELTPRNDVVGLLSARRAQRRARRNRKKRHRAPRFNNRVHSKHKGWLAPSVEVKIQEHITAIKRVCRRLPITSVIVETAEFDVQRLKAIMEGHPLPVGEDYQLGEMHDTYNVRQYVLFRDGYKCRCCSARSKHDKKVKLHVHHIESRQVSGNVPNNLITLCTVCHDKLHKGKITLDGVKRGVSFRAAAFMGIMRKMLIARLRDELPVMVCETQGYITKYVRETYSIEKSHTNDARCIANKPKAKSCDVIYKTRAIRHHNRQIHKCKINKDGTRKRNQLPYFVKGFRLWDKVSYKGEECFIQGRRANGFFAVKKFDGTVLSAGVSSKKLKFLETANNYIIEREVCKV